MDKSLAQKPCKINVFETQKTSKMPKTLLSNWSNELKKYETMNMENFLANPDNFPLASYWLRLGMEAILTIGTHILSRLPQNGKNKDYTQVFISLGGYGVIPQEFAQKVRGMAGYRNRLVHLYWEIKPEELLAIIKNDLSDFEEFIKHIKEFIGKVNA